MIEFFTNISKELLKLIAGLDTLSAIIILFGLLFLVGGIMIAYYFGKELKSSREKMDIERKHYTDTIISLVREVVTAVKDNTESNHAIVANVQINTETTRSVKETNDKLIETLYITRK